MAYVHTTWLTGNADQASTRKQGGVITVGLPDSVSIGAPEGDHADSLGRALLRLGAEVLALNGTCADELAVREFVAQEDLVPELLPTLLRFPAYLDSVRANPLNELALAEVEQ